MSRTANKKKLFNAVMAIAAAAIVFAGVMIAGSVQGWFGPAQPRSAQAPAAGMQIVANNKIGSANIEREGIAYSLKDGTTLRDGDIIETLNGSTVDIAFGKGTVCFNQNSEAVVRVGEDGAVSLEMKSGELFADVEDAFRLYLMGTDVSTQKGVFSASAPAGSAAVYVFENSVRVGDEEAVAGQRVTLLEEETQIGSLSISALNDFNMERVRKTNEIKPLCFTTAQLDEVISEREAEMQAAAQAQALEAQSEQQIASQREQNKGASAKQGSANTGGAQQGAPGSGGNSNGTATGGAGGDSSSGGGTSSGGSAAQVKTCTIEIRCDTILDNMENLEEGKNKYVPANGVILARSSMTFEEGETVLDVLKRACAQAGIQLEYSFSPIYNSSYVEGMNNLYEFDCGNESGWMYKVNGWFPNYGCSAYTLKDKDAIVWCYTCNGLGADVGGGV